MKEMETITLCWTTNDMRTFSHREYTIGGGCGTLRDAVEEFISDTKDNVQALIDGSRSVRFAYVSDADEHYDVVIDQFRHETDMMVRTCIWNRSV